MAERTNINSEVSEHFFPFLSFTCVQGQIWHHLHGNGRQFKNPERRVDSMSGCNADTISKWLTDGRKVSSLNLFQSAFARWTKPGDAPVRGREDKENVKHSRELLAAAYRNRIAPCAHYCQAGL